MEAKQFISILKHPKELANINLDELNALSQQYPFVSLFHTLIAKKAYEEKPYEYDAYLTKAAMHALDRTKLYYIIHDAKREKKKYDNETTEENSLIANESFNSEIEIPTIPEKETIEEIADKRLISEEPIPFVAGSFTVSEQNIEERESVEETSEINVAEEVSEQKELKKEKKKHKKHKKKSKVEEIAPDAQLSFTDWLKLVNKKKLVQPETEQANDEEEDEKDLEKQYHAGKFEAQLHKEAHKEVKAETTPVPKIPEKWKKVSDVKAEVKISDLAQRSIQRDDNTITETLAKILELQKHYDKAIEAYEKLSLKYPEKSSYFATRILELKKKL